MKELELIPATEGEQAFTVNVLATISESTVEEFSSEARRALSSSNTVLVLPSAILSII